MTHTATGTATTIGELTQIFPNVDIYVELDSNGYRLNDTVYVIDGASLLIAVDGGQGGTISITDFDDDSNPNTNNFGLSFSAAQPVEQPSAGTSIYNVGEGEIITPNGTETIGYTFSSRSGNPDQALLNDRSLIFFANQATALWNYDGDFVATSPFYNGYIFEGGNENDRLIGGGYREWLHGRGGDDYIEAGDIAANSELGSNFIEGGLGSDYLIGGEDGDFIWGNDRDKWYPDRETQRESYSDESILSSDYINGGAGRDFLSGDEGDDIVEGGSGSDDIYGGAGSDTLSGGDDSDLMIGDSRIELTLYNGSYIPDWDYITADDGSHSYSDIMDGGDGDDFMIGEIGADLIYGGAGGDRIWGDRFQNGDEFLINGLPLANYVALDNTLSGDDTIFGGAGDDEIDGNGGNDSLYGGDDNDILRGDDETLEGQYHGQDKLHGDAGADILIGGGMDDELIGGDGDDFLVGDATRNAGETSIGLSGQYHGNDTIDGGLGNDHILGGGADDTINGGGGDDIIYGDSQYDDAEYTTPWLDESFHGNDVIFGGAGNDGIHAGSGDDEAHGGDGNDRIYGGNGDDTLSGGSGSNYLNGGSGADTYLLSGDSVNLIEDSDGSNTLKLLTSVNAADFRIAEGNEYTNIFLTDDGSGLIRMDNATFANMNELTLLSGSTVPLSGIQRLDAYTFDPLQGTNDTFDINSVTGDSVNIHISGDVVSENVAFSRSDDDLLITFINLFQGTNSGTLMISGYFNKNNFSELDGIVPNTGLFITYGEASNIVDGLGFDSTLSIYSDVVTGGEGEDVLEGTWANDTLRGNGGNDVIFGKGGEDTIIGGAGDDELWGSFHFTEYPQVMQDGYVDTGEKIFVFNEDDGNDIIRSVGYSDDGARLEFSDATSLEVVHVSDGYSEYLKFNYSESDSVLIDSHPGVIGEINDIVVGETTLDKIVINDTNPYGGLIGAPKIDTEINAFSIDDSNNGTLSLRGNIGNDILRAVSSDGASVSMAGGFGDDWVDATGVLGDLYLFGGEGDDTFLIRSKRENTKIDLYSSTGLDHGFDRIVLTDITSSQLINDSGNHAIRGDLISSSSFYSYVIDTDITSAWSNGESSIYYQGEIKFDFHESNDFEIVFADGEVWSKSQFISYASANSGAGKDPRLGGGNFNRETGGSVVVSDFINYAGDTFFDYEINDAYGQYLSYNDATGSFDISPNCPYGEITLWMKTRDSDGYTSIWGQVNLIDSGLTKLSATSSEGESVSGGSGDDYLSGLEGDDILLGNDGDDVLVARGGNDELTGGLGNDFLKGGAGSDKYFFAAGDGHDTIDDSDKGSVNYEASAESDAVIITGYSSSDATFSRDNNDLAISFSENDSITIIDYFSGDGSTGQTPYYIQFDDNDILYYEDIRSLVGGINSDPQAQLDYVTTSEENPVVISFDALLSNDTDSESDPLSITNFYNAEDGVISVDWLGRTLTFTPNQNFSGATTLNYTLSDGENTSEGQIMVMVSGTNDTPVANADTFEMGYNTELTINAVEILQNDQDPDFDQLSIVSVNNGVNGSVNYDATLGTISYTPDTDFVGIDSFSYTITDGLEESTSTVSVDVLLINTAPVGVSDSYSAIEGLSLTISESDLIANDLDAQGDSLSVQVVGNPTNGSVSFDSATGYITFTPDTYFTGSGGFEYTVSDGELTDVVWVDVNVSPDLTPSNVIAGTSGVDTLSGGGKEDLLYGLDGNDTVGGGRGNDQLDGGLGNDLLAGDAGDDTYIFSLGGGIDTIDNTTASNRDNDILELVGDISKDNLWFTQSGNDLWVDVIGTNDRVIVQNWYNGEADQLDAFHADGQSLINNQVDQLVSAMAAFTRPDGIDAVIPQAVKDQLEPVLASTWQ